MFKHPHPRWSVLAILLGTLLFMTAACAPERSAGAGRATAALSPSTAAPTLCEQELVPPQITEIQPTLPVAGGEFKIIASGGLIRDSCGGYIEGAKMFHLYLDDQPIGDLSCYVNRCERQVTLPATTPAGRHCLSVKPGECQFEFQVSG